MASQRDQTSTNHIEIAVYGNVTDQPRQSPIPEGDEDDTFDYSQRTQWLRAAVLGANDGLVSVASLMMGVGAVKQDVKTMLIAGFAGLVAGACSMAIGEFVSVYTQYDIEISQMKREMKENGRTENVEEAKKKMLPNPAHAALASAIAFSIGAVVPLLGAAFISEHKMRLAVVAALVSVALVVFGGVGARLGGSSVVKSCARVLVGGWMAMTITFALTKLIGSSGLQIGGFAAVANTICIEADINPSHLMIVHAMNTEDFKSFSKVPFAGHTEVAYVRAIFALSKPLMHRCYSYYRTVWECKSSKT
ncbi:hypothetical protein TB2_010207 [Malus domestica]